MCKEQYDEGVTKLKSEIEHAISEAHISFDDPQPQNLVFPVRIPLIEVSDTDLELENVHGSQE